MKFIYKAKDSDGKIRSGLVMAADQTRAEQLLADNSLTIISLDIQQESLLSKINPFGRSVPNKDMVLFSRQLATLISARVPILQSLRILQEQVSSKYLTEIIGNLIAAVENGESLSLAMSRFENVFGSVYTSLIRSGEASGSLDKALNYLAEQLEKDYELKSKVKSAMTYPAFVVVALLIVGVLMFKFVLPKLTSVLEEQGGDLPAVSKGLIVFTRFFDQYWWLVIIAIIAIIVSTKLFVSTKLGRYEWDKLKIKLPLVGPISKKIYLARFARNLSTLVVGGIPIIKALQIVAEVVNNQIYRDILYDTVSRVTAGQTISEGISRYPDYFPVIVSQMVRVGEQTAQLDDIMAKLAIFYEKEVDTQISTLTTLLEPLIMVVLGVGVGLLVAGVLLPIYNMASTVG
ncbi:MAG: type II secretion system F family protein [Patescibacteria group bacterium]|nr:type II secretion system F family protein [Patescibacteria group bacterium]